MAGEGAGLARMQHAVLRAIWGLFYVTGPSIPASDPCYAPSSLPLVELMLEASASSLAASMVVAMMACLN